MPKPSPRRDEIISVMRKLHESTGKVALTAGEIHAAIDHDNFPATRHVSAILVNMRDIGLVIEMDKVHRPDYGKYVTTYALVEIVDAATTPNGKGPEPAVSKDIVAPLTSARQPGPTAKPQHVNRPPLIVPKKEDFERKAIAEGDKSAPEKNAVGETVNSVPAHEFRHYDGNQAGGKLTTERRPNATKQAEAEFNSAVTELVEHIRNTEGPTMAVGAPKHGTPEHALMERDKRIDRLADMLEKAIGGITNANRESIARQEMAYRVIEKDMNDLKESLETLFKRDVKHTEDVLTKFMTSVKETHGDQLEMTRDVLKLFLNIREKIDHSIGKNAEVLAGLAKYIEASSNNKLVEARAYQEGWNDAKAEMESTHNSPTKATGNTDAIVHVDEMARKLGLKDIPKQTGMVAIDVRSGEAYDVNTGTRFNLFEDDGDVNG